MSNHTTVRMEHERMAEALLDAITVNENQIMNSEPVREWASVCVQIAQAHIALAAHIFNIEARS